MNVPVSSDTWFARHTDGQAGILKKEMDCRDATLVTLEGTRN